MRFVTLVKVCKCTMPLLVSNRRDKVYRLLGCMISLILVKHGGDGTQVPDLSLSLCCEAIAILDGRVNAPLH